MQPEWKPKPGDVIVRRPREAEIGPVHIHVERRSVSVRGPTSPMLLVYGFLAVITAGALLLILPFASTAPGFASPVDAVFTATSAVTVTGLVVVPTDEAWTGFGQAVILVLMFVGGLGFMTGAAFLLIIITPRVGLQNQLVIREGLGGAQLGGIIALVRRIVVVAIMVQLVGIGLLFLRFYVFGSLWPGITVGDAAWQSVFHGVSAFNNAGFDIFPSRMLGGSSLIPFADNYWILGIMGILIVIGGLGFLVLNDVIRLRRFSRYGLETKLILVGSAVLVLIGAILFLVEEHDNPDTLGPRPVGQKIADSAFHSIAARTAGFSTLEYGAVKEHSAVATEVLMFIGGASASTAGGIKVNTFMIIVLTVIATVRSRQHIIAFGREIPDSNVRRAMAVGMVSVAALVVSTFLLASVHEDLLMRDIVFEVVSAFGTVGLSTGITSELNAPGRIIVTVTMFVGRLGPLTLALLMAGREVRETFRLPEERVRIG